MKVMTNYSKYFEEKVAVFSHSMREGDGVATHIKNISNYLDLSIYSPDGPIKKGKRFLFNSLVIYKPFIVKESIIHVHGFTNTFVFNALLNSLLGKPVVWSWHGSWVGLLSLPFWLLFFISKKLGWVITSVNPKDREKGAIYVPNGVRMFKRVALERKKGFAFIGRFDKNKNPLYACKLFYNLHKKGEEGPFYFLGKDYGLMEKTKLHCKKYGIEAIFDFWDKNTYYERLPLLKAVVLPSKREGQPLVMLESFSAGTAFFTFKNGSEETIKRYTNKWRMFILEGNVERDSHKILSNWKELSVLVRSFKLNSWKEIAEKYKLIYKALKNKKKGLQHLK